MNGENDHLFDAEHLDLCPVCDKNPCECKPEHAADCQCSNCTGIVAGQPIKPDWPVNRTLLIHVNNLTKIGDAEYVTEASDLGWKPGFWPTKFMLFPLIGNGRPFFQSYADSGSVLYRQADGDVLVEIFND